MSSKEIITKALKDENTYNYAKYLREYAAPEEDIKINDIMNTLELFAYGDYQHFLQYEQYYISLDKKLLLKLIQLTILTIAGNEGQTLKIDQILKDYKLDRAIEHYGEIIQEDISKELFFENIIIDMVDESLIEIKFDEIDESIIISRAYVIRDAYDPSYVSLRVLTESDIASKNLANALENLQKWFDKQIKPTKVDLDNQLTRKHNTKQSMDINLRKRKPSDNSTF